LAACDNADQNSEIPMTSEDMPMDPGDMPVMQSDGAAKTGSAEGGVTAIDAAGGTITIDHGAVASVGWPAMTMAFEASEDQLGSVAVGDTVAFTFLTSEDGNSIETIAKK
jgi:Cu/Ag efflux protein CusF